MTDTVSFSGDLSLLFLASARSELIPVERALRDISKDYAGNDVARRCRDRPDEIPVLLAESVARFVSDRPEAGRYGDQAADLALMALERLGVAAPASATIADIEAAVLAAPRPGDAPDGVVRLAAAIAELRRKKLARARRVGLAMAAPTLTRAATPDRGGIARMAEEGVDATWRLAGDLLARVLPDVEKRTQEARAALKHVNVMVAGRTGVGKSTLINAIFGREVAKAGVGRPVTQDIAWFEPEGLPLRLCDTKGLEMETFAETLARLDDEIEKANAGGRVEDRIHVLWLCIDEYGGRVQDGEVRVAELCARHRIPVIVVLTKAFAPNGLAEKVREILPHARDVVRVLVEPFAGRPVHGLSALVQATDRVLPDAIRAAFDAAQQVDIARKRTRALTIARTAAASAAAAAAVPIPVADAAGVLTVNVGMVTSIAVAMGVRMDSQAFVPLAGSIVGALAATTGGRLIAGQVLKLIPGVGSIAGALITATVSSAATYGLGYAFTEFLCAYHRSNGRMPEGDEIRNGFREFWRTWGDKVKSPAPEPADPPPPAG